jgi:hypothetical protein
MITRVKLDSVFLIIIDFAYNTFKQENGYANKTLKLHVNKDTCLKDKEGKKYDLNNDCYVYMCTIRIHTL